ncbi:hypothetical protein [Melissospora conviva]|uniref:hypothetical protein n=1 Tax=Melissospora conviva TaxID=3388432 RepID=UPI003C1658EC
MDHVGTWQESPTERRPAHAGRHRRPPTTRAARRPPFTLVGRGHHVTVGYTLTCYALLLLLPLGWALTRTGACTGACGPTRGEAVGVVLTAVPGLGLALAMSLPVALLLQRVATGWRPASVGVAAAVVGGAVAMLLVNAVTGDPPA